MMKWYVVHTQTGFENRIKATLLARAEAEGMKDKIAQVMIPTEKVAEVKGGRKTVTERKFFPGYILVEMELTDEAWYLVRSTPGISGFVGSRAKPVPLSDADMATIMSQEEEKNVKPKPKTEFTIGENIRVKEGAFANFNGTIEDIHPEKGKLRVMLVIFGRSTPVELEYWQVEKI